MRNERQPAPVHVESLPELDALVGRYLMNETPRIFWEEQQVCLRFETVEEALESMRDPYFQNFLPKDARPQSTLKEVQEFPSYSTDLTLAWQIVDRLSVKTGPLRAWREDGHWAAAFGETPPSHSREAPTAICLAALLAAGIPAELAPAVSPISAAA